MEGERVYPHVDTKNINVLRCRERLDQRAQVRMYRATPKRLVYG